MMKAFDHNQQLMISVSLLRKHEEGEEEEVDYTVNSERVDRAELQLTCKEIIFVR